MQGCVETLLGLFDPTCLQWATRKAVKARISGPTSASRKRSSSMPTMRACCAWTSSGGGLLIGEGPHHSWCARPRRRASGQSPPTRRGPMAPGGLGSTTPSAGASCPAGRAVGCRDQLPLSRADPCSMPSGGLAAQLLAVGRRADRRAARRPRPQTGGCARTTATGTTGQLVRWTVRMSWVVFSGRGRRALRPFRPSRPIPN